MPPRFGRERSIRSRRCVLAVLELLAIEIDLVVNARNRKPAGHRLQLQRALRIRGFNVEPRAVILPGKPFDAAFVLRYQDVLTQ